MMKMNALICCSIENICSHWTVSMANYWNWWP